MNNKKSKQKTLSTTNPETSNQRVDEDIVEESRKPLCPLAAKDSEWVDMLQTSSTDPSSNIISDEVDCESGPQIKPLAIMFPGLLEKDPVALQGMLNKAMSTTEVTRHLVDLGQKANFTFMKTADRLIPRDKQWLERLTENSNSFTSMASSIYNGSFSSDYDADNETTIYTRDIEKKKIKNRKEKQAYPKNESMISKKELFASIRNIISEIIQDNVPS